MSKHLENDLQSLEQALLAQASVVETMIRTASRSICQRNVELVWDVLDSEVSDFLLIDDGLIPPLIRRLARPAGRDPAVEAGESGVAGLAALIAVATSRELRRKLALDKASRVLVIGSEGVTDPDIFARIMRDS